MAVRNYLGVFGHVVLDHIVSVPSLPARNASVRVLERARHYGGTGGNIARIASRLGVRTALASFVGEDFPEDYRQALAADGVDLRALRVVRGATTPTAWIFSDGSGDQSTVIDQGPMWDAPRRAVAAHAVRSVQVVHLGTGRPEYYARVADLAAKLGRTVAFDPSQEITYAYTRPTFLRLLRRASLFFGNEPEIAVALKFAKRRKPEDLLDFVDTVVVTRGRKGSVVHTGGEGTHRIPRVPPRKVVDVTGAGDAYRAGYYAGLSRGYDPARCGLLGSTVASFVIEAPGTQTRIPTWEEAVRRASRHGDF